MKRLIILTGLLATTIIASAQTEAVSYTHLTLPTKA